MIKTDSQETFCIREAKGDGYRVIMVVNETLKNFDKKELFPWCLHIIIDIESRTEPYNLPTNSESDILNTMQDNFSALICSVTLCRYIGRITGYGKRELYYYVEDPEKIHQKLTAIIQNKDYIREFEYSIKRDIEWKEVNFFFDY